MIYIGLDVSLNSVSVCVVDGSGAIIREGTVFSDAPSQRLFCDVAAARLHNSAATPAARA